MRLRTTLVLAALPLCAARPVHAQEVDEARRSRPGWSVERTMRELLGDPYEPRGFFPTKGEWTWVVTTHYPHGPDRVGVHRFPAAQTDSALGSGGPVCDSFHAGDYVVGGTVMEHARSRGWRRVGATRFVPPGRPATFPVFVEWRREDGRWVISSFGERGYHQPRLLGRDPTEAVRGPGGVPLRLPLSDSALVAAGAAWFESNEPITVGGHRITKYGLPRQLGEGDVVRWGVLRGVGVYVETGSDPRVVDVVYIPVDRSGSFQPYQNMMGNGCRH